ncbi:MAG: protein-L-isoaspartate(D-aspartate) O-methyltransferase [Anaerolineae bacterium]|nr:protein-L-isoaspartate(D-aspartate) O-methyltransferase [Anaerolineae bacterium]
MRGKLITAAILLLLIATACKTKEKADEAPNEDSYSAAREALVEEAIVGRGITTPAVIEAMNAVPRHEFVPDDYLAQAYADHPLPIGYGQTISQPYIVALMTDALNPDESDVILEVGTGSGYQAAVLAEIVDRVYTIEIVGALAEQAGDRLDRLGYTNVEVLHDDGYFGWEDHAPFDAIIVTAAPDHIPPPLLTQLKDGGKMVIPVGPVGGYQELWLVEREGDDYTNISLGGVRFVPLTRDLRNE